MSVVNSLPVASLITEQVAEEFSWGQKCKGWWFHSSSNLSVIKEQMPPKTREVVHYHKETIQHFYVLSGRLTIQFTTILSSRLHLFFNGVKGVQE